MVDEIDVILLEMYEDCDITIIVIKKNSIMFYKNQYFENRTGPSGQLVRQWSLKKPSPVRFKTQISEKLVKTWF